LHTEYGPVLCFHADENLIYVDPTST